jgi:hypothetical protein
LGLARGASPGVVALLGAMAFGAASGPRLAMAALESNIDTEERRDLVGVPKKLEYQTMPAKTAPRPARPAGSA